MSRGVVAEFVTYHYELQPGDATRYTFALTFPDPPTSFSFCGFDEAEHINFTDRLLGSPQFFVQIAIRMPSWQGIYSSSYAQLRDLHETHIRYLAGHMNASKSSGRIYTITAVCLAASVLIDDPLAVRAACEAMLKVSELFPNGIV